MCTDKKYMSCYCLNPFLSRCDPHLSPRKVNSRNHMVTTQED